MPELLISTSDRKPRRYLAAILTLLITGCGGTNAHTVNIAAPPPTGTGVAIYGQALAGTKPLAGATVQLFAAGVTGNGSAPTSLSSSATTDLTGAFTIPAGYTCPAASSQLYLLARNGAVAPASGNAAAALIVTLGRCGALTASTKFTLNEVTTAATAWALAQFLSPAGNIGASATNTSGLANAVATALSLAGNTTGASPGPTFPATGISPAPRINAVGNLLNTCTASAASCAQLFSLTIPSGRPAPTDTLAAALNLVRNPGANVPALFTLAQTSTAFSPTLSAPPADWTLPLTFTGGGLKEPGPLALDSHGNVWVAGYPGVASQFSPIGAPTFASGITGLGLSENYGLAIDPSDNVWITDEASPGAINGGFGAVTKLSASGQPLSNQTGFSTGGLNFPIAVAIDPNGTAWVVDYGNSHLTLFDPSGPPLSGPSGFFSNLFAFPVAIALDASHNAWIANMGGDSITRVSPNGQQFSDIPCCNTPSGLALDAAGNIWVANYLGDSISQVSPTGAVLSTGYTGGGLLHPQGIAIDGAGTVWVANFRGNSISEFAGAASAHPGQPLSPPIGWAPPPPRSSPSPSPSTAAATFGSPTSPQIASRRSSASPPLSRHPFPPSHRHPDQSTPRFKLGRQTRPR